MAAARQSKTNIADNIDNMLLGKTDTGHIQPFFTVKKEEESEPEVNEDEMDENLIKSRYDKMKFEAEDYALSGLREYLKIENDDKDYTTKNLEDSIYIGQQDTDIISAGVCQLKNNSLDKLVNLKNSTNETHYFGKIEQQIKYNLADHNYALITEHEDSTTDTCSEISLEDNGNSSTDTADTYSVFSLDDEKFENNENERDITYKIKIMMSLTVNLENWGPKLDKSSRFCKNCKTLFPTDDSFFAHSVTNPSCLTAVGSETTRTNKSTTRKKIATNTKKYRQYKLSPTKNKLQNIESSSKEILNTKCNLYGCQSCDVYFMSESALDRHSVCNHVKGKIEACDLCGLRFTKRSLPFHYRLHHGKKNKNHEICSITDNESSKTSKGKASAIKDNEDNNLNKGYKKNIKPAPSLTSRRNVEQQKICLQDNRASKKAGKEETSTVIDDGEKTIRYRHKKKLGPARPFGHGKNLEQQKYYGKIASSRNSKSDIPAAPIDNEQTYSSDNCIEMINSARFSDNVLYKCSTCSVCFWHIRLIKNHKHYEVKSRDCPVCGLVFSMYALSAHISFHHDKLKLKLQDFDVMTLIYLHVGEETPQSNENSEPESLDIEKVTKTYQRQLNLRIKRQLKKKPTLKKIRKTSLNKQFNYGRILYKCAECDCCFLTYSSLAFHIVYCYKKSKNSGNIAKCSQCGYSFTRIAIARHGLIHHEKMKLNREDFFIRTNILGLSNAEIEELDKSYSESIRDADPDEKIQIAKALYTNSNGKKDAYFKVRHPVDNVLYKCDECMSCFWNKGTARHHYHHHEIISRLCCICGLTFTKRLLLAHVIFHHEKLKLNLEDFEIRNIKNVKYTNCNSFKARRKQREMLFMCTKCKCCFLEELSVRSHNCKRKGLKKCKLCSYLFKWQSIKRHMELHHEKKKFERKDFYIYKKFPKQTKEIPERTYDSEDRSGTERSRLSNYKNKNLKHFASDNVLYKCIACSSCFLKLSTAMRHTHTVHVELLKCNICGLLFRKRVLQKHINIHHDKLQMKLDDFLIKDFAATDNSKKEIKKEKRKSTKISLRFKTNDKELKCSDNNLKTDGIDEKLCFVGNKKKVTRLMRRRNNDCSIKQKNLRADKAKEINESVSEQEKSSEKNISQKNLKIRSVIVKPGLVAKKTKKLKEIKSYSEKVSNGDFVTDNSTPIQSENGKIDVFKCTPDEVYRLLCASGNRHKSDFN